MLRPLIGLIPRQFERAAHSLAIARAPLLHETAGAFGGWAIGLNGIVTVLIVPFSARWLTG